MCELVGDVGDFTDVCDVGELMPFLYRFSWCDGRDSWGSSGEVTVGDEVSSSS